MKLYDKLITKLLNDYLRKKLGADIDVSVSNVSLMGAVQKGEMAAGEKLFVEATISAIMPAETLGKIIERKVLSE